MAKEFIMQMRPWFGAEEKQALMAYMDEDGFLTEFKKTEAFEQSIAQFTGAKHCVVVNNGTISLTLAAMAAVVDQGAHRGVQAERATAKELLATTSRARRCAR